MVLLCFDKAILFLLQAVQNTSANNFSAYNHSFQENYTTFPQTNQGEALHIINSAGIAYHPQLVAVYHQAAGGFMHGYAVMIYHRKAMDDIQPRWG